MKELNDSLSKAYNVHGHCHSVGKSEDEANGATKLGAQTSGYQIIRPSYKPKKN